MVQLSHLYMTTGKTIALTVWTLCRPCDFTAFTYDVKWHTVCHSFPSEEQASFNFMAAVTICSDFGALKNKVRHCFHCFPIYVPWSDGTGCHDLSFLILNFKPAFSFSSFTLIKRLFMSASKTFTDFYISIIILKFWTTFGSALYIPYNFYFMDVIALHISLSIVFIIFWFFSVSLQLFMHCNMCLIWLSLFMMKILQKYLVMSILIS